MSSSSGCLGNAVRKDWAGWAHRCQTHQWDRCEPQLFNLDQTAVTHTPNIIQYLNIFKIFILCNVVVVVCVVVLWCSVCLVLLQWCTPPTLNGSNPTETCQSNSTSGVTLWSVSSNSHIIFSTAPVFYSVSSLYFYWLAPFFPHLFLFPVPPPRDGSLNTPSPSWGQESFCGRRAIQPSPPRRRQLRR